MDSRPRLREDRLFAGMTKQETKSLNHEGKTKSTKQRQKGAFDQKEESERRTFNVQRSTLNGEKGKNVLLRRSFSFLPASSIERREVGFPPLRERQ
jgi:hypothetical protein